MKILDIVFDPHTAPTLFVCVVIGAFLGKICLDTARAIEVQLIDVVKELGVEWKTDYDIGTSIRAKKKGTGAIWNWVSIKDVNWYLLYLLKNDGTVLSRRYSRGSTPHNTHLWQKQGGYMYRLVEPYSPEAMREWEELQDKINKDEA